MRTIDLARAVGLSVQQVRNYEAWGFVPKAVRGRSGYRTYTDRHLEALRTARTLIEGYGWRSALAAMRAVHTGDVAAAWAEVDSRHAALDRRRSEAEQTRSALCTLAAELATIAGRGRRQGQGGMRIGEAARQIGVRASALRFWEGQGLVRPEREAESGYRSYDELQLWRLRLVVLLRDYGYDFDAIRSALAARERALLEASRTCAGATAALWRYTSADA